jgi:hypothetical protein
MKPIHMMGGKKVKQSTESQNFTFAEIGR